MYQVTTRAIRVTVEPTFLDSESAPDEGQYFWAYKIEIANLGEEVVQLRERHWRIIDANGRTEELSGEGVVGKQPVLKPGESFSYTSGCPLSTASGIMVGSYRMETGEGEVFSVSIPAFSLDLPDRRKTVH